jgi:hypothetical protein
VLVEALHNPEMDYAEIRLQIVHHMQGADRQVALIGLARIKSL